MSRIARYAIDLKLKLVAYSLMPNHFHFQTSLCCKRTVSKFMHKLCVSYGLYFNTVHQSSGRVFQGPYKCKRIQDNFYFAQLAKYIHQNATELYPPKTKWIEKIKHAKNYPWSSYKYYNNPSKYKGVIPKWLDTRTLRRIIRKETDFIAFMGTPLPRFTHDKSDEGAVETKLIEE